jgi:RimJ/RimL family protein N-acetyltransferase
VELLRYEDADFELAEALETDPVVMRELGGPIDLARVRETHRLRVSDPWYFKIVIPASDPPIGTIGIWEKELDGAMIFETGWMVLPAFQGRGIATAALDLLIQRAREEPRFESVHAFPPVTNAASNALCRRFAFSLLGERDFVYAGRTLRCNQWMLATPPPQRHSLDRGTSSDRVARR